MSGSAENAFAYIDEDKAISLAYKIATDLDGPKHAVDDLIEFFKLVPDKDIMNLSVANWDHKSAEKKFLPIIERQFVLPHATETENCYRLIFYFHHRKWRKIAIHVENTIWYLWVI